MHEPATSVPCERIFSHVNFQLWDRRSRLSAQATEDITFLYENDEEDDDQDENEDNIFD